MTQLERLIARVTQVIKDSPCQVVTIRIVMDTHGVPITWQVDKGQAEGLQPTNSPGTITAT